MEYLRWQIHPRRFPQKGILNYFKSVDRTVSTQTLYNYLEHIETSMIVRKAHRYDIRGKQVLTSLDKYYLTDLGLGRIHNSGFKLEMGALLENVVYNELIGRGYEVYVGKIPKGEVDFVAIKNGRKRVLSGGVLSGGRLCGGEGVRGFLGDTGQFSQICDFHGQV